MRGRGPLAPVNKTRLLRRVTISAPRRVLEIIRQHYHASKQRRDRRRRATARMPVPNEVDTDVRRVFGLVKKQLAREPYPSGFRVATRWRDNLHQALAAAGRRPNAPLLAYLSLLIFDVGLT